MTNRSQNYLIKHHPDPDYSGRLRLAGIK